MSGCGASSRSTPTVSSSRRSPIHGWSCRSRSTSIHHSSISVRGRTRSAISCTARTAGQDARRCTSLEGALRRGNRDAPIRQLSGQRQCGVAVGLLTPEFDEPAPVGERIRFEPARMPPQVAHLDTEGVADLSRRWRGNFAPHRPGRYPLGQGLPQVAELLRRRGAIRLTASNRRNHRPGTAKRLGKIVVIPVIYGAEMVTEISAAGNPTGTLFAKVPACCSVTVNGPTPQRG
jgi:hypothetical protein